MSRGNDGRELPSFSLLRGRGPLLTIEGVWRLLRGRRRSFADDVARAVTLLDPPARVEGLEVVPPRDPFLLVANHYQAPGLWVGWEVLAVSDAIAKARVPEARDLHWLVTAEWRWFELAGHWIPNPVSALLFPRAAHVWGMIPTPARPSDVAGRALALRHILTYLGCRDDPRGEARPEPVGVFPEGTATMALAKATPGFGAFVHLICKRGVPVLPVGIYPEAGTLIVRFGPLFRLGAPPATGLVSLDEWASEQVMTAIARLLPEDLRGAYAAVGSKGE